MIPDRDNGGYSKDVCPKRGNGDGGLFYATGKQMVTFIKSAPKEAAADEVEKPNGQRVSRHDGKREENR